MCVIEICMIHDLDAYFNDISGSNNRTTMSRFQETLAKVSFVFKQLEEKYESHKCEDDLPSQSALDDLRMVCERVKELREQMTGSFF